MSDYSIEQIFNDALGRSIGCYDSNCAIYGWYAVFKKADVVAFFENEDEASRYVRIIKILNDGRK